MLFARSNFDQHYTKREIHNSNECNQSFMRTLDAAIRRTRRDTLINWPRRGHAWIQGTHPRRQLRLFNHTAVSISSGSRLQTPVLGVVPGREPIEELARRSPSRARLRRSSAYTLWRGSPRARLGSYALRKTDLEMASTGRLLTARGKQQRRWGSTRSCLGWDREH